MQCMYLADVVAVGIESIYTLPSTFTFSTISGRIGRQSTTHQTTWMICQAMMSFIPKFTYRCYRTAHRISWCDG
ncbi:hypothetical protein C6341_g7439 [Phytophthora cactorum]|nr:hypothetical protein C6341_g7439 [Phytophthora cactorum]